MKNSYTIYSALLLGLLGLQGANAQTSPQNLELTKQVLTFGDWQNAGEQFGVNTQGVPTQVKDFFYNRQGKLLKTVEGKMQLGDNPATIMTYEKLGDVTPQKYTSYNYNEAGQLVSIVECAYEADNGWFFSWKNEETVSRYAYDEKGKLATKKDGKYTYAYTWNGEQLVKETKINNGTDETASTLFYSDFVDAQSNCAKKVIEVTAKGSYYIENEYDAQQHLIKSTKYVLANAVTNENGEVSGEKGTPCSQKTSVWDAAKSGYLNTEYTYENNNWKAVGATSLDVVKNHDLSVPVADITVTPLESKANSVAITFNNPTDLSTDIKWNVYRNGVLLGHANFFDNQWNFEDFEAANGVYDYYVMADTLCTPGCKAISNVVSVPLNTEVQGAKNLRVFESGKNHVKDGQGNSQDVYVYNLAWDAPETPHTILGYNLYLNGGAQPVNSQLIRMPYYELVLDNAEKLQNKVVIEVVYAEGYALSEPVDITLDVDHEINQNRVCTVQRVITYGNTMGGSTNLVNDEDVNYYDADNKLVMTVSESRMQGDDPDTPEVEKVGDIIPTSYIVYDYNEKNQLVRERSREFGIFSGYDRAWNKDIKTTLQCKYDEATGKLIERAEESKTYRYEWEGDNMVTEASFSNRKMEPLGLITYSNFSEYGVNLPQYGLGISKHPYMQSYNRVYEFDYDQKGRLIAKREFKHGDNVEKDENGVIIKADKGTPVQEELWVYEGDQLKGYYNNMWKSSANELRPYSKKEYTLTGNGVREINYTYSDMSAAMGWTKSSIILESVNNTYYGETAPGTLTITDIEDKVNSVRLTCDAPMKTYGAKVVYEVFRNGTKVGEAQPGENGKLTFEEYEVPNGTWHYLIKAASAYESVDFLSTNVVEKVFDTALPPVQNVAFPVNGVKENGDYQLIVTWDAPDTNYKIIGYNVYTDIRSYTKNPSPVNGVLALPDDTRSYEFAWASTTRKDKTVCIETVYNIGKIKSENYPVTLQSLPTGIVSNEFTAHMVTVGNDLLINGNYESLSIYAANGARVAGYSQTHSVNMNALPNGVYVVKLVTATGVETLKVIKK